MLQHTSREALDLMETTGKRAALREAVYQVLKTHGPLTQPEVWGLYFPSENRYSVVPRVTDLKKANLVREIGKRKCQVTGHTCILWEVTPNENPS